MDKYILSTIALLSVCLVLGTTIYHNIESEQKVVNINGFEIEEYNLKQIDEGLPSVQSSVICNMKANECLTLNLNKINNG